MRNFGAPFCRGVEPFLANLQVLIASAESHGVGDWPAVVSARAVFEDIDGMVAYIPYVGTDCARHTTEVQRAIAQVQTVLNAIPGYNGTPLPRPDATPSDAGEIPLWVKIAGGGVLAVMLLHYITPFVPRRRVAGYRRRSRR